MSSKAPFYSKRRGKTPKPFIKGAEPRCSRHGIHLAHVLHAGGSLRCTEPPPDGRHSNTVLTAPVVFGNKSLITFQMCSTLLLNFQLVAELSLTLQPKPQSSGFRFTATSPVTQRGPKPSSRLGLRLDTAPGSRQAPTMGQVPGERQHEILWQHPMLTSFFAMHALFQFHSGHH